MTNHDSGAWEKVMDTETTREELDAIVARETTIALVDVLTQIDGMRVSRADKQEAWRLVIPLIAARTRLALETAWLDLRRDTTPTTAVH